MIEKTHQAYLRSSSIGKSPRFSAEPKNPIPGPGSYIIEDKPTTGASFATSKRSLLFSSAENPAPGSYNIPSCFDNKKSFTFCHRPSKSMPQYPGPGSYDVKDPLPVAARVVFGKEKRKNNFFNSELARVPGPGKYSTMHTQAGPKWRFGSSISRKQASVEASPGPGSYDANPSSTAITFKFPSGRKPCKVPNCPGPGYYETLYYKSPAFSMTRADKLSGFSGQPFPGPGDYLPS